jgi:hypothetical protein
MPQGPWDDDELFDRVEMQRHIDEILPSLRGLTPDEAEPRLMKALRARGLEVNGRFFLSEDDLDPSFQAREMELLKGVESGDLPVEALDQWQSEMNARIESHNARAAALIHAANVKRYGEDLADSMWADEHDPVKTRIDEVIDEELDGECSFMIRSPQGGQRTYEVRVRPFTEVLARAIESAVVSLGAQVQVRELDDGEQLSGS